MIRNLNLKFIHSSLRKVISSDFSYSVIRHTSSSNVPVPIRYRDTQIKSKFLIEEAGLSREKAFSMILSKDRLRKISLESMKESYNVLRDHGYVYAVENYPELLCIDCSVLKNRILLLDDCKFNKNKIPELLLCFHSLMNKKLSTLKHFGILPPKANIIENFFRVCDVPLSENTIEFDDWDDFRTIYDKFYKFYVQRELGLSDQELEETAKPFKAISIQYLRYNVKLVRDVFHFNSKDLQLLKCALHAYPDTMLHLFNTFKNEDMKKAIKKNPKVVNVASEVITKNSRFLKEKSIAENAPTYVSLLAMQSELKFNRLSKILDTYELQPFVNHPRLLELIKKSHLATERLEVMKQLNMRCITLNQLITNDEYFVRHISHGIDKVQSRDKFTFLCHELPYTRDEIKRKLLLNPYTGYVPLYIVTETTKYLKTAGFSAEDIFISLPLVLYHKSVVERAVVKLVPKLLKSMDYPPDFEKTKLKAYLPLVMYCIEKQHNFSGNGVWIQEDESSKRADLFTE